MPPTEDAEARSGGTLAYLLAYVAWLVSGAGIFYALIRWREALLTAYPALGLPKNALGVVDKAFVVVLGVVGVGGIAFLQGHYTQGAERRWLVRRFLRVTLIEVLAISLPVVAAYLAGW